MPHDLPHSILPPRDHGRVDAEPARFGMDAEEVPMTPGPVVISVTLLALLLAGCEPEWVRNQYERCYNAGGSGDYNRVTFVFTCWKRTEPPSRGEKLYESKYK